MSQAHFCSHSRILPTKNPAVLAGSLFFEARFPKSFHSLVPYHSFLPGFTLSGLPNKICGFRKFSLIIYNSNCTFLQQGPRHITALMRDLTFSRISGESLHFPWALQACSLHLSNISSSDFARTVKSQFCLKSLQPNSLSPSVCRAIAPTSFLF